MGDTASKKIGGILWRFPTVQAIAEQAIFHRQVLKTIKKESCKEHGTSKERK